MTQTTLWTLDELVGLVGRALSVDYDGPPSGRIRELPDRRLVRWYVTRGLVDRPAATNGRNALYGRRHLLQLVAIKRRQSEGRSLAQIQAELAGATDSTLERLARLSSGLADAGASPPAAADPAVRPLAADPAATPPRPRFWVDRPAAPDRTGRSIAGLPASTADPGTADPGTTGWPLRAIELGPGVTLVVDPARTAEAEPDAVRNAARQLLGLLLPAATDETERSTP